MRRKKSENQNAPAGEPKRKPPDAQGSSSAANTGQTAAAITLPKLVWGVFRNHAAIRWVEAHSQPIGSTPAQTHVPLSQITLDKDIQCRAKINNAIVTEYAERMEAGDTFPPLVVFREGDRHLLVDGFHRYRAAQKCNRVSLAVEIHDGTRRDAIQCAIRANCNHGLPRTSADKRRAVKMALREFPDESDHSIAAMCKVSHPFVGKVRKELETVTSSTGKRVGRDGKRRKMPQRKAATESTTKESGESAAGHAEDNATQSQADEGAPEEFDLEDAWTRIKHCLSREYASCPAGFQAELSQRLRAFADGHC